MFVMFFEGFPLFQCLRSIGAVIDELFPFAGNLGHVLELVLSVEGLLSFGDY